ncbi:MAG TPA: bifunctional 4'-phosphopantothenoylcysteine decarboxylase/phosphopantothenoylcysteine synthetase, partial [Coxiellaceae bacterium]|nr:bifunctional 4'-phosphopantothenoylcysteine decarboxylase/phosphopantothenoylcysteine synthetase [Coxiellaceae bacterium]
KNLVANAKEKLINKKLNMIIANKVGSGLGFDSDDNEVVILHKNGKSVKFPKMRKNKLARELIKTIRSAMLS